MRLRMMFTPRTYASWACTQVCDALQQNFGGDGAADVVFDSSSLLAHFLAEQTVKTQAIGLLEGVTLMAGAKPSANSAEGVTGFTEEPPTATLAIRNALFITYPSFPRGRSSRGPELPADDHGLDDEQVDELGDELHEEQHARVEFGTYDLRCELPPWTTMLLTARKAAPSEGSSAAERWSMPATVWGGQSNTGASPETSLPLVAGDATAAMLRSALEALTQLSAAISATRLKIWNSTVSMPDTDPSAPLRMPAPTGDWRRDWEPAHGEFALNLDFTVTELRDWLQSHGDERLLDTADTAVARSHARSALQDFIAHGMQGLYEVDVYREHDMPMADLDVFGIVLARYGPRDRFRATAYEPCVIKVQLPPWTAALFQP